MKQHSQFILKPMSSVVEDAVAAVSALSLKLEVYPLIKYIREALLLRMTGFQEQKIKCVLWEMATDNYELRYKFISGAIKIGEGSRYDDKKTVYKILFEQIKEFDSAYMIDGTTKSNIIRTVKDSMDALFEGTVLKQSMEREYSDFQSIYNSCNVISMGGDTFVIGDICGESIKDFHDKYLIRERNRIAHNTVSYQDNLPSFGKLIDQKDILRNFFLFYAYLMMIDELLVVIYSKYLQRPKFM